MHQTKLTWANNLYRYYPGLHDQPAVVLPYLSQQSMSLISGSP